MLPKTKLIHFVELEWCVTNVYWNNEESVNLHPEEHTHSLKTQHATTNAHFSVATESHMVHGFEAGRSSVIFSLWDHCYPEPTI